MNQDPSESLVRKEQGDQSDLAESSDLRENRDILDTKDDEETEDTLDIQDHVVQQLPITTPLLWPDTSQFSLHPPDLREFHTPQLLLHLKVVHMHQLLQRPQKA